MILTPCTTRKFIVFTDYLFTAQSPLQITLTKMAIKNIVGKEENAPFRHNVTLPKTSFCFRVTFFLSSPNALNLDSFKILSFGKGSTLSQTSSGFYVSAVHVF